MRNIYFSIIVPAFNLENYIHRSIISILNQCFQDFELIIVNDASIDKTADIIYEFSKQNPKITVLNHSKNESQHIARMNGVAAANGKYTLFLDGDDYFTKDAFSILYDIIQKNPDYDIYEYGYIRQPSGVIYFPFYLEGDRFSAFFDKENAPTPTMWNKVYNTELLKKAFAVMERAYINNGEDLYEAIVVAFFAKKIMETRKIITNYQIGAGISTAYRDYDKTIELLESTRTVINLIGVFLQKNNLNISLDNLIIRFLKHIINTYINSQKNKDDKKKLFLMLPTFFGDRIMLEYLFQIEESHKKDIEAIICSKSYRIGQSILYPLRKLKRLLGKS